jgi:hypothetical protein
MERGQASVCGGRKKHRAGGGCMHLLVDSLRPEAEIQGTHVRTHASIHPVFPLLSFPSFKSIGDVGPLRIGWLARRTNTFDPSYWLARSVDAAPLIAAQSWKRRRSLFPTQVSELAWGA